MRDVPDCPVFSRPEALAYGWSDAALHRAVRAGRLIRLRRGYFTRPAATLDPVAAAVAAALGTAGAVISHRSAALLHGLPLVGLPPDPPQLTVPPRRTGDVSPGHLYRATLRPLDVTALDGVPVTSIARTLVDLARSTWLAAAVSALDFALHDRLVDADELHDVAAACKRWPGARGIAPTFELADSRSESPLESCSRLMFRHVGLPDPDVQANIYALTGAFLGRADFYWPDTGVIGEADGRSKYVDRDVLVEEKLRQERLEQVGLVVVRWSWTDVRYESDELRRRLERAFARGRARDAAGLQRSWQVTPTPPEPLCPAILRSAPPKPATRGARRRT